MFSPKAMLVCRNWEMFGECGKEQPLQDLDRWAEEGHRSVGSGVIRGFLWFEKRDHNTGFPDGGDGASGHGQVEEVGQELQAFGTDVFEVDSS